MAFAEDQLLPMSALQHLLFCERQCALIHLEQLWTENEFTAEGKVLHERAHEGPDELQNLGVGGSVRITRGLPVRSFGLGLSGQCDVVEFHRAAGVGVAETVVPVEYKRGKPKAHSADEVQLCAQAMALEEMLGRPVGRGALYYGQRRRRTEIIFDDTLRELVRAAARRLHAMFASRITPPAVRERKCDACSLLDLCLPDAMRFRRGAAAWFAGRLQDLVADSDDQGPSSLPSSPPCASI